MWSAHLFQTTTGNVGPAVDFESLSWGVDLNDADSISIDVSKSSLPKLDLNYWLAPWWAGVLIMWNGNPIAGGPILSRPTESFETIGLSCAGIRAVLARRLVSREQTNWANQAKSVVSWKNLTLGTIAKKSVQITEEKYGGALPISYPIADRAGKHERNYRGFNVQNIDADDILTKLSEVINGPDIMFRPRMLSDNQVTFDMLYGDEIDPRIPQKFTPVWDTTADRGMISEMRVITTGTYMTNRTYSVGAGQDEGTLIRVNTNEAPLQKGYPLLETVVSTSNSENADVVDDHGVADLWANRTPLVEIQMTVRADGSIPLGQFWPGDLVEVVVKDWLSLPDGVIPMRILSMTGDSSANIRVSLQTDDRFS